MEYSRKNLTFIEIKITKKKKPLKPEQQKTKLPEISLSHEHPFLFQTTEEEKKNMHARAAQMLFVPPPHHKRLWWRMYNIIYTSRMHDDAIVSNPCTC